MSNRGPLSPPSGRSGRQGGRVGGKGRESCSAEYWKYFVVWLMAGGRVLLTQAAAKQTALLLKFRSQAC